MPEKTPSPRVAFSPGEFAALFGKSQTWGYRQIYAGKVKTITEHGRILIPAKEVERILESAGIYNGRAPTPAVKGRLKKLKEEQQSVWRRFVEARRQKGLAGEAGEKGGLPSGPAGSWAGALSRLRMHSAIEVLRRAVPGRLGKAR